MQHPSIFIAVMFAKTNELSSGWKKDKYRQKQFVSFLEFTFPIPTPEPACMGQVQSQVGLPRMVEIVCVDYKHAFTARIWNEINQIISRRNCTCAMCPACRVEQCMVY